MHRARSRLASLIVLLAALTGGGPRWALAQTGTVRGTIVDGEGTPVELALVRVLGLDGGTPSEPSGSFTLSLPPGTYTLVIESPGFSQRSVADVVVAAGETTEISVAMESFSNLLDPPNRTAEPWRSEPTSSSPAHVTIIPGESVRAWGGPTFVESVLGVPGFDAAQTGLTPSNVVGRGFNNVFSGSLLVLTDYRYARLPSLRLNAYNMIPETHFDVERIELVLGPAAALYGPNSANGVLHVVTSSPIDRPGTSASVAGGERETFDGAFRHAMRLGSSAGLKLSGQYFRGLEWEHVDPVEVANAGGDEAAVVRDPYTERMSADVRLDVRPWGPDGGDVVVSGGVNSLDGIELTPLGAAQASDWRYMYGHLRLQKGGFFSQAFLNQSDAQDTHLLRTGGLVIDQSRAVAAQARYAFFTGQRYEWVAGLDAQRTEPRTAGTIMGSNEDHDVINEVGGYVHSRIELSERADLVSAVRIDRHDRLDGVNISPRVGFLFTPSEGHNVRLTYNRAFNTPTTNNLFLDLVAARIPLGDDLGYDLRAVGTPTSGFSYEDRCSGGLDDLCMRSPFATASVPADGALVWDEVLDLLARENASLVPLVPLLEAPGSDPGDPGLTSTLLRFDQQALTFVPDEGPQAIERLRATFTNTVELGYKGLIADKLSLSVDVYSTAIRDFIGPLRVETPSVFLTSPSIEEYVTYRLSALLAGGTVTEADVDAIVAAIAQVPLGTVAPDQRDGSDILMVSRNFGDLTLWGADFGLELHVSSEVTVMGSFSYVSENCFDFSGDGACRSSGDVALNAPSTKGSVGLFYRSALAPVSLGARMRYVGGFPMNSGAFIGDVDPYTVFDTQVALRLPGVEGATVSLTAKNLLDREHQEFIGAPALGRLTSVRLTYSF